MTTEYSGGYSGEWVTLEEAERRSLPMGHTLAGIGPRRPGMIYRSGYWGDVNTVLAVHVKVDDVPLRSMRTGKAAVHWEVTERTEGEKRIRRHCTSWEYDARNAILPGPADMRV